MEQKLVSAIITTHNRPYDVVIRALKSILNQTYDNIEIIVVDDSENYPFRETIKHLITGLSEDIIYIQHDENKGACAARNTGLSHAKGFYVAFLDDDDEWLPTKIEEQTLGFIDEKIALVYCGHIEVDENHKTKRVFKVEKHKGYVFDSLLRKNYIGGSSNPLIKRTCIEKVGCFDVEMQSSQDYDLWLRLASFYQVNYIDKELLYYHIYKGERISDDNKKRLEGLSRINQKYKKHIDKDVLTWYMRYKAVLPYVLKVHGRNEAFSIWVKCLKRCPLKIIDNIKQLVLIIFGEHIRDRKRESDG